MNGTQAQKTIFAIPTEPRYDVVVAAPGIPLTEPEVRRLIARHPGRVEFIRRIGPQQVEVRLATPCIYDVVVTLEAVGFEVVRVVATSAWAAPRPAPAANLG